MKNISGDIGKALKKLGITELTEVQEKSLKPIMEGRDLIVRAKTGSGKTFAFLIPIIERLTTGLEAVILVPTRELAKQVNDEARKLAKVNTAVIYGGVKIEPQMQALKKAQIVVATPGRMLDHISRGTIDLDEVKYVVLDEADRMLDMGFIDDVRKILDEMPKERQTTLFSATMPDQIADLAKNYMKKPDKLLLQKEEITVDKIEQKVKVMDRKQKLSELIKIIKDADKVMVFSNTKIWAEKLADILKKRGINAQSIHSGLSQNRRQKTIERFNKGQIRVLIASDVAARGLHIENVSHVVNYDIPRNPKDYIHRIGRTGRAGKTGKAITFITEDERNLLSNIEEEIKMYLDVKEKGGKKAVRKGEGDDWGLD